MNSHLIILFPTSKGLSEVSERVSAAERASEASRAEWTNEWAVWENEQTDERVAQYSDLYSWLLWPTVHSWLVWIHAWVGRFYLKILLNDKLVDTEKIYHLSTNELSLTLSVSLSGDFCLLSIRLNRLELRFYFPDLSHHLICTVVLFLYTE